MSAIDAIRAARSGSDRASRLPVPLDFRDDCRGHQYADDGKADPVPSERDEEQCEQRDDPEEGTHRVRHRDPVVPTKVLARRCHATSLGLNARHHLRGLSWRWISRWWAQQRSLRLLRLVGPPRDQYQT